MVLPFPPYRPPVQDARPRTTTTAAGVVADPVVLVAAVDQAVPRSQLEYSEATARPGNSFRAWLFHLAIPLIFRIV
jgi:hypothetical protein